MLPLGSLAPNFIKRPAPEVGVDSHFTKVRIVQFNDSDIEWEDAAAGSSQQRLSESYVIDVYSLPLGGVS